MERAEPLTAMDRAEEVVSNFYKTQDYLPWLIRDAIEEAVLAEREACAMAVLGYEDDERVFDSRDYLLLEQIMAAIRARKQDAQSR